MTQKESTQPAAAQAITVEQIAQTLGPVAAKLAAEGAFPDPATCDRLLAWIAEHGPRKARRMVKAHGRFEARRKAEKFRQTFGGSGRAS